MIFERYSQNHLYKFTPISYKLIALISRELLAAVLIDSIIIEWSSGYQQVFTNQIPNDCFTIVEENNLS